MGNANSTSPKKKKRSGCLSSQSSPDSDDDQIGAGALASTSSSANPRHGMEATTMCEPTRNDGMDASCGAPERSPPNYKRMPQEFIEQSFKAYDLKAVDAVTAKPLQAEHLAHLVALRPLFVESPYLRGGRSPDEMCAAVYGRMCRLGQKDAAAVQDCRILARSELLTLIWRLLSAPLKEQWEALVYLFHDPSDCGESEKVLHSAVDKDAFLGPPTVSAMGIAAGEMFMTEEDFAHLLALAARLAVESSCALVGRSARRAYLSSYGGEPHLASIARSRRTAAALASWADERLPNLGGLVGLRVLLQAIDAASLGAAGCLEQLHEWQQRAEHEEESDSGEDGGHRVSPPWHAESVATEVAAGLLPMLDKRSHILSAEGLFLLQAFLPRSSAQGLKRLYCSKADGHSLNRLSHCITGYKAPSLALFKDELHRVIAILNHQEWRDSPMFQEDSSALILTLAPRFSCIGVLDAARDSKAPKSTKVLYLNTGRGTPMSKARGGAWPVKGMGAGGEGNLRLAIDENLEGVRWMGGSEESASLQGGGCDWSPPHGQIEVCEVWGLGGAEADEAQDNYRIRQMKMIERARTVDRAAMFGMRRADGGWDDCPDKFILDMAGITSANSDDFRR